MISIGQQIPIRKFLRNFRRLIVGDKLEHISQYLERKKNEGANGNFSAPQERRRIITHLRTRDANGATIRLSHERVVLVG